MIWKLKELIKFVSPLEWSIMYTKPLSKLLPIVIIVVAVILFCFPKESLIIFFISLLILEIVLIANVRYDINKKKENKRKEKIKQEEKEKFSQNEGNNFEYCCISFISRNKEFFQKIWKLPNPEDSLLTRIVPHEEAKKLHNMKIIIGNKSTGIN